MNRAVDIINTLRVGVEAMLSEGQSVKVNFLRFFNFEKNRVSLRIEKVENGTEREAVGMIDVVEFPSNDKGGTSCNCQMTELQTGKTDKLIIHLKSNHDKNAETTKVFNFFRKVLNLPEAMSSRNDQIHVEGNNLEGGGTSPVELEKENLFPPNGGALPKNPRGAHRSESTD